MIHALRTIAIPFHSRATLSIPRCKFSCLILNPFRTFRLPAHQRSFPRNRISIDDSEVERAERTSPSPKDHLSLLNTRCSQPAFLSASFLALQPSSDPPTLWLAAATIIGLPLALWVYKCIMMVVFQRKIIYMGYVPPGARKEELGKDISPAKGIHCEEVRISGDSRVQLSGILVQKDTPDVSKSPQTLVLYCQGNAGNPLSRLPVFERLLFGPAISGPPMTVPLDIAILAIAPRSYWKSTSRTPTEHGLISDYKHALQYAIDRFPASSIILYGHSLGGAVAVCLSAKLQAKEYPLVRGLILENPFASIPGMVRALYPQKWLPYHYLGSLAFDKWDALSAMQSASPDSLLATLSPSMMLILSQKDELVPQDMGQAIFDAGQAHDPEGRHSEQEGRIRRKVLLRSALHENAWQTRQWVVEMRQYISDIR